MKTRLKYSDFWDQINVDAFEEAIQFTPIDTHNDNDIGHCLWPENHSHGDTTGKFAIHREKRVYNCFVCGGGSLLSLTMELFDYDVEDATEWLVQFAEADMRTDQEFADEFINAFANDVENRVNNLPYFNERVLDKFSDDIPVEWMVERDIDPDTLESNGVRFSLEARRPAPRGGRFADDDDYFGPAVIFPHYWFERLVGWQSRWLDEDRPEWVPKYTMTTDFPKENTVWGYDTVVESSKPVVVVESVPSAIFLRGAGFPSVATFGSSVNKAQMRLLRRFSEGVILAPDNDSAGEKWLAANTDYLKRFTRVWHLPYVDSKPGADVGDIRSADIHIFMENAVEYGVL